MPCKRSVMDEDIRRSRERISRRRALGLGGTIGLGALVTACTGSSRSKDAAPTPALSASSTAPSDVLSLLDQANTCVAELEETQGPYWFDVDSIRSDLREDRPGTPLLLAVRAHDMSACTNGSPPTAIPNSVVEIWHSDAGGAYSGFESASQGGPGAAVRAAAVPARRRTARTASVNWRRARDAVFSTSPYNKHTGRETRNEDDSIFDQSGLVTIGRTASGYLGVINVGVTASAA